MTAAFRENWKRLSNKGIEQRYTTGEDNDIVRFKDMHLLSANATGLVGFWIDGAPASGEIIKFDGDSWGFTADDSLQISGVPTGGQILKYDGTIWVPVVDNSGLPTVTTVGDPGLDTQTVTEQGIREAINSASGLSSVTTVGDPGLDTQIVTEQGIREALDAVTVGSAEFIDSATGAGNSLSLTIPAGTLAVDGESIVFFGVTLGAGDVEGRMSLGGTNFVSGFSADVSSGGAGFFIGTIHRTGASAQNCAGSFSVGNSTLATSAQLTKTLASSQVLTVSWVSTNTVVSLIAIKIKT